MPNMAAVMVAEAEDFMAAVGAVSMAVVGAFTEEAASLVEDSMVAATSVVEVSVGAGIAVGDRMADIAVAASTEGAGLTVECVEACGGIRLRDAAQPDRGAGLRTAAPALATCRRAGIRLDPAVAGAWPGGRASARVPGSEAGWPVRTRRLPTGTGMDSAARRLIMPR